MADSYWIQVSEEPLTEADEQVLNSLLMQLTDPRMTTVSAVAYSDEERSETLGVYTVALSVEQQTVFATVYEHPARIVNVMLRKPEKPKSDPAGDAFDAMVAHYNEQAQKKS